MAMLPLDLLITSQKQKSDMRTISVIEKTGISEDDHEYSVWNCHRLFCDGVYYYVLANPVATSRRCLSRHLVFNRFWNLGFVVYSGLSSLDRTRAKF